MDEMNINMTAEAATETVNAVAQAVESAVPATKSTGVTLPKGGAIALGVAGLAGATTLAYIGGKKAVAMVKDFKEYRKLKKRGALAKAEATEKSADGTEKPIEAEVVNNETSSDSNKE